MSHLGTHSRTECEQEAQRLLTMLWPQEGVNVLRPGLLHRGRDRDIGSVDFGVGEHLADPAEQDTGPATKNEAEIQEFLRTGSRLIASASWGELGHLISERSGQRSRDRRLDLTLLTLEGRAAAARQEWLRAIPILNAAVAQADRLNENRPGRRMDVDLLLVEALIEGAYFQDAERRFAQLGPLYFETLVPPRALAMLWRVRTLLTMTLGETGRAREEADLMVSLAQMSEDSSVEAWCRWTRGRLFSRLGVVPLARVDLERARELAEKVEDGPLLHRVLQDSRGPETWELTLAETRVFNLVAAGETNADIANSLNLSIRTVESHVSSIFRKSGVGSRLRLVAQFGNRAPQE